MKNTIILSFVYLLTLRGYNETSKPNSGKLEKLKYKTVYMYNIESEEL